MSIFGSPDPTEAHPNLWFHTTTCIKHFLKQPKLYCTYNYENNIRKPFGSSIIKI